MTDKIFHHQKVRQFGYELFKKIGVAKSQYIIVVDELVETSLRGVDSHGVRLLPHYIRAAMNGRINKNPHYTFRKSAPATGVFDADNGFGIAAGVQAMDKAIQLASKAGMGGVGVIHSTHFGAAAIYGLRAARKNMIGMAFTDVDSLVFPTGGRETYFGTNPICFTAPIEDESPFCLDMATSRVPLNKILNYRASNKKLETGWAVDKDGKPTIDPELAVSPLPLGGYKGYGLASMVSIISSVLTGMPFGPHIHHMYPLDNKRRLLGHFFLAINISNFRSISGFKRDMKRMVHELRSIKPVHSDIPVLVSGDPEKKVYAYRVKKGISLPDHELSSWKKVAADIGVDIGTILE